MNLDIAPWITRLEEQVQADHNVREIGGAVELADTDEFLRATPSIFVLPFSEAAEPNAFDHVNRQRVTETISIITAVNNARDAAAQSAELRTLRTAIKAALLLWTPSANDEPVQFAGGEIWRSNNTALWWHDRYTTRYHHSVTAPAA